MTEPTDVVQRARQALDGSWEGEYAIGGLVRELADEAEKWRGDHDGLFSIYNEAIAERNQARAERDELRAAIDRVKDIDIDDGCPCCCSWVDRIDRALGEDQ